MNPQSNAPELTLHRHDLVFVSSSAWRSLVEARAELWLELLADGWVDRGWPLVARRALPGEPRGIALGLSLPPAAGRLHFDIVMRPADVVSSRPPLALEHAIADAPPHWQPTLAKLLELGLRHGVKARVFGGLAWRVLTHLDYLTARSDLDLLVPIRHGSDAVLLAHELAEIERTAPMRLDVELVRADGAGANWRELLAGKAELLVKTLAEVKLMPAGQFLCMGGRS
ncbi:malonate decarboxylase holo-[acyl-carrier-protein] synthase [Variovorax saccharolyticus]|uniref:malonate decarboxylase holo-[acyl-carrier-protein] synthase n=1 Tax=Variovorax saccharolyticus TaxID=3053516 RepID=UPI0025769A4F|nr:malonate decarboxylase holo-[acyl-carrier-protein] synthase [Variovorax sp. J31P216]MDM0025174.1 malonate decarboxylase holo-[acyl-carrier-protein] synthase [Variovorax sp. J31P216]